jgi:GNAT superfamily N-acetyltransferase
MSRRPAAGVALSTRLLRRDDWPVIAELFGPRGACGGCWCMHWQVERGGKLWTSMRGEPNRQAFKKLVESGGVRGVFAFSGDVPVGWCCFGPHHGFPRLARARSLARDRGPDSWCVVCFYIRAGWRGAGVASRLLEAATGAAFAAGAAEVEGFPVNPSGALPNAFAWTGLASMFEAAGYRRVSARGGGKEIYLKVRPGAPRRAARPRPG